MINQYLHFLKITQFIEEMANEPGSQRSCKALITKSGL